MSAILVVVKRITTKVAFLRMEQGQWIELNESSGGLELSNELGDFMEQSYAFEGSEAIVDYDSYEANKYQIDSYKNQAIEFPSDYGS